MKSQGQAQASAQRIDTHALQCLDALVRERHVSRAAQKIGIGQPAMSEMLARLRVIFSDPLLVRTARGMAPTQRAIEAVAKAREALRLIGEAVTNEHEPQPAQFSQPLRIMAVTSLAFSVLPLLLGRLQQSLPQLKFTIEPGDIRRTRELLESDGCDLVFGYPPLVSGSLHVATLYKYRLCCIVRRGHPHIGESISLDQFLAFPHVSLGAGALPVSTIESEIDKALRRRQRRRSIGVRVPDLLVSAAIVSETDYIAVVPMPMARRFESSLDLRILELPLPLADPRIMMIWHERSHRDPVHQSVRREARLVARSL